MGAGFRVLAVLIGGMISLGFASQLQAQKKYNPDDEVIERMARASVEFLVASSPRNRDDMLISALVCLEVGKRYDRTIPKDNPIVVSALNNILQGMGGDGGGRGGQGGDRFARTNAVYQIALAIIILCDVDDQKYSNEIKELVNILQERQSPAGGFAYLSDARGVDVSQTQYAALALFVAKHHGFKFNPNVAKRMLEWLTQVQTQEGSWYYQYNGNGPYQKHPAQLTLSLHASGLGTTYLLGDLLQLNPRAKNMANLGSGTSELPPSVSVYVKPKSEDAAVTQEGPLVKFDRGKLASTKNRGNSFIEDNFDVTSESWPNYYLYALERYAYFREQSEGSVRGIPDWYDRGVDHLRPLQQADGSFARQQRSHETPVISTALATLFLVRSSEVLVLPPNGGLAAGQEGFEEDKELKLADGKIRSQNLIDGLNNVSELLQGGQATDKELEAIADSMDKAVGAFFKDESRSQAEKTAFMRALVKDRNYFRRLIACKFLAREQNMDNVPALLYALGDPDLRICREAHNGLRLISRRIDAFPVSSRANRADFDSLKEKWTAWFLKIRPDAELFD